MTACALSSMHAIVYCCILSLKILSWQIGSLELLNGASNQWLQTKTGPAL